MITLLKATVTVLDGRATTVLVTPNTNTRLVDTLAGLCANANDRSRRDKFLSLIETWRERERRGVLQTFWKTDAKEFEQVLLDRVCIVSKIRAKLCF